MSGTGRGRTPNIAGDSGTARYHLGEGTRRSPEDYGGRDKHAEDGGSSTDVGAERTGCA